MTQLTGKAKDDFVKQFCGEIPINDIELNAYIIEWLDSVGIYIESRKYAKGWGYDLFGVKKLINEKEMYSNRQLSIKSAIGQANEIYNAL